VLFTRLPAVTLDDDSDQHYDLFVKYLVPEATRCIQIANCISCVCGSGFTGSPLGHAAIDSSFWRSYIEPYRLYLYCQEQIRLLQVFYPFHSIFDLYSNRVPVGRHIITNWNCGLYLWSYLFSFQRREDINCKTLSLSQMLDTRTHCSCYIRSQQDSLSPSGNRTVDTPGLTSDRLRRFQSSCEESYDDSQAGPEGDPFFCISQNPHERVQKWLDHMSRDALATDWHARK
jgi:hypothetical protein